VDDRETAAEWLQRADEDALAAGLLHERGLHALSAFHAQQAAEKALKGVLIAQGRGLGRTHDLDRLAADAKAPAEIADAAAFLAGFYLAGRYPDAAANITTEDAALALVRAQEVLAWSRRARS
jgi:HEPN domain-containing protein